VRSDGLGPIVIAALSLISSLAVSQVHDAAVTPSGATVSVGESRMFRVVDAHGCWVRNVRWNISPPGAAEIVQGEEATVKAIRPGVVTLVASADGTEAEARVQVVDGRPPVGTPLWLNDPIPGCRVTHSIPANQVDASGPQFYTTYNCSGDSVLRAFSSDGRELWRTLVGSPPSCSAQRSAAPPTSPSFSSHSPCDAIHPGLDKQHLSMILKQLNLSTIPDGEKGDVWTLEGDGFLCKVTFDPRSATVMKVAKIITNE
jgi:hypothetical protein